MPADDERDPLERWLDQRVQPLPPPPGTFELITRRARRRKVRKAVISAVSAAGVAAAVAIAVPAGLSLNLNTPTSGSLSAGSGASAGKATQSVEGSATPTANAPRPGVPAAASASAASGGITSPGFLPANFIPSSVTWDSLSTGWVIGQAGTAGKCDNANPDICTSIARTSDGGATWAGLPAPSTGGPESATGVTGLRFLNATYGWAFGPELWATDNGGGNWHKVSTGSQSVTDLETANGRAYALFADCPASSGDIIAACTSYTLMTATAGSGNWTAVSGVPSGLTASGGGKASAQVILSGSTGYLEAPDGALYSGPLGGGAWSKVSTLACAPGAALSSGLPGNALLASAGGQDLALLCESPGPASDETTQQAYWSADGGATWTSRNRILSTGAGPLGTLESLTATPDGTFIVAIEGSSPGIWLLASGTSTWDKATLANSSGSTGGFSYVGMTSATQGVALGGSTSLHAIWMTTDGGQTWQVRPIKS
jgi:hypothetical protein